MDDRDRRADAGQVTTALLDSSRWDDFVAVFAGSGGCDGCWCFNHHIRPGEPDVRGDAARDAKQAHVAQGRAFGVIGYVGDRPVGWCALDRARDVPGHDCTPPEPAADLWSIHCFYTHPDARGRGVARALLERALEWLHAHGSGTVEAYPTPKGREPFYGGFAGPYALFEQHGFEEVGTFDENFCRVARAF